MAAALGLASAARGAAAVAAVIWSDSDGEVLVHFDATRVVLHPGLVLVGMTLESDQTGRGELVVPFAVGSPGRPAGLLATTEPLPRGPQALVDRWGEAVIAAAWLALVDVAHGLALHTGIDRDGAGLLPAAISTDGEWLTIVPQARFETDRIAARG